MCLLVRVVLLRMSLTVTKASSTLTITWPSNFGGGLNDEALRFIVVVDDVESGYRMVTTPLSALSLVAHVAIPPYFSSSASCLVVTVHLCQVLGKEAAWKTVESLTAAADGEEVAWENDTVCEHGLAGIIF